MGTLEAWSVGRLGAGSIRHRREYPNDFMCQCFHVLRRWRVIIVVSGVKSLIEGPFVRRVGGIDLFPLAQRNASRDNHIAIAVGKANK